MTQTPGTPEPIETTPTPTGPPVPPPYGPTPSYEAPTYAAPSGGASYTDGPAPKAPKVGKTKLRVIGGVAAAIVIILLKFGAVFGLGSLFHHVEHGAGDAEKVVTSALESPTADGFLQYVAPGTTVETLTTDDCLKAIEDSGDTFTIPKSTKTDDGAEVKVDLSESSTDLQVHLVDEGGWKIDKITCD